jgi:succinoglycan biosynthesis transport protein ExoP
MLDRLSVPRRSLDFEDYVDILRRNIGWIIGPIFAGLVVSTVVAYSMEDTYVSSALLRIVPQQISPQLVQNVTAQELTDHIASMAQMIKSRNTLTNLITSHQLYQTELKHEPIDDVLQKMSDSIDIRPVSGVLNVSGTALPAMEVSFSYRDKYKAKEVTSDIVTRFMDENVQEANALTDTTTEFVRDEYEKAKRDLEAVEQKLADYRQKNAGRLPDDVQLNMTQMNALESQLGALNENLSRNYEQRMMLESNLRIAQEHLNAVQSPAMQAHDAHLAQLDQQIQDLQNRIAAMTQRYTEDYPDLQAAREQLALLQKQRADYAKEKVVDTPSDSSMSHERLDALAAVQSIQTQLKANELEKRNIERDIQNTRAGLSMYESRLAMIPSSEKEYADLLRQEKMAQAQYDEFHQKLNLSMVSGDLERRRQGETLEVIDPASLPDKPTAPKRQTIIPIGAAAGLCLGLVLVAIREIKDTSLKNLKDARLYTQLPILGSVPLLENDLVVQRRKQIMWVGWATATLAGLAIIAGSIAHYYLTKA